MALHPVLETVTNRIIQRSKPSRGAYWPTSKRPVSRPQRGAGLYQPGARLCGLPGQRQAGAEGSEEAIGGHRLGLQRHAVGAPAVRALSAIIKQAVREVGAVAQFAGGTPAMCDGVTQGQPGMELSLFSRDAIAMAAAVALSHNMFDAALYLGVCDKIVPGLLIGALHFGHLPAVFVPAGR
jgi:phosphogluconate dehydratase